MALGQALAVSDDGFSVYAAQFQKPQFVAWTRLIAPHCADGSFTATTGTQSPLALDCAYPYGHGLTGQTITTPPAHGTASQGMNAAIVEYTATSGYTGSDALDPRGPRGRDAVPAPLRLPDDGSVVSEQTQRVIRTFDNTDRDYGTPHEQDLFCNQGTPIAGGYGQGLWYTNSARPVARPITAIASALVGDREWKIRWRWVDPVIGSLGVAETRVVFWLMCYHPPDAPAAEPPEYRYAAHVSGALNLDSDVNGTPVISSATVTAGGAASVAVTGSAGERGTAAVTLATDRDVATLAAAAGRTTLATARFKIGRGGRTVITLKLTRAGRSLVAKQGVVAARLDVVFGSARAVRRHRTALLKLVRRGYRPPKFNPRQFLGSVAGQAFTHPTPGTVQTRPVRRRG